MRVLQLGKYFPPFDGGIETVSLQLCEGLAGSGIRCDVLCFHPGRSPESTETAGGYTVIRAATHGVLASTPLSVGFVRWLSRLAPAYDVLHVHCPNPMAALALRLVNPATPVVLHWHSDVVRQKRFNQLYRPLLGDWLAHRADAVLGATSAHIEASDYARIFAGKSHVIPYCLDPGPYSPELMDQDALARLHARFPGKKAVFALGRLISYKGFDVLVDAAARLPDDWVVLIGGSGPMQGELENRIASAGLSGKAVLLGKVPQPELSAHYTFSRMFCLPSVTRAEMFGVVQIEAMACARPVISTRIPGSGAPLVNEHGVTGLTVEPNDPDALAQAILHIDADQDRWRAMGEQGLAAVHGRFSPKATAEATAAMYQEIVRKKKR